MAMWLFFRDWVVSLGWRFSKFWMLVVLSRHPQVLALSSLLALGEVRLSYRYSSRAATYACTERTAGTVSGGIHVISYQNVIDRCLFHTLVWQYIGSTKTNFLSFNKQEVSARNRSPSIHSSSINAPTISHISARTCHSYRPCSFVEWRCSVASTCGWVTIGWFHHISSCHRRDSKSTHTNICTCLTLYWIWNFLSPC